MKRPKRNRSPKNNQEPKQKKSPKRNRGLKNPQDLDNDQDLEYDYDYVDYSNEDQRIVGGKRANKGQFPYQVNFFYFLSSAVRFLT